MAIGEVRAERVERGVGERLRARARRRRRSTAAAQRAGQPSTAGRRSPRRSRPIRPPSSSRRRRWTSACPRRSPWCRHRSRSANRSAGSPRGLSEAASPAACGPLAPAAVPPPTALPRFSSSRRDRALARGLLGRRPRRAACRPPAARSPAAERRRRSRGSSDGATRRHARRLVARAAAGAAPARARTPAPRARRAPLTGRPPPRARRGVRWTSTAPPTCLRSTSACRARRSRRRARVPARSSRSPAPRRRTAAARRARRPPRPRRAPRPRPSPPSRSPSASRTRSPGRAPRRPSTTSCTPTGELPEQLVRPRRARSACAGTPAAAAARRSASPATGCARPRGPRRQAARSAGRAGSGRCAGPSGAGRAAPTARPVGASTMRAHAHAALTADELLVLLAEPAAGAEQRALDSGAAHAEAVADLAVREALELAHDEDVVVGLRQPAEGAAEVVDRELGVDDRVGARAAGDHRRPGALVGVERDLAGVARAAERVDARVLGDLVDPRLEGDRRVGRAQPAQRGDEDLLRDVLGAAVVAHHPAHVGRDAALIAHEQQLEGAIVAGPDGSDEIEIIRALICGLGDDCQGRHDFPNPSGGLFYPAVESCFRAPDDRDRTVPFNSVLANLLAYLDELLVPGRLQRLRAQRPAGSRTGIASKPSSPACRPARSSSERAAELDADLVLVHHGIFWAGAPLALTPAAKRRLRLLFEHDMALAAYHLPLDGHAEVGNNALIATGLGCASHAPFALHKGMPIGVAGTLRRRRHRGRRARRPRARADRPRAARLPLRARARAHDRHRLGRGIELPRGRDRGRPSTRS